MLFNSISFLIFFPVVTLVYFLIPHKIRYLWLLGASYYFYMCWNPQYALLMATSTLLTYLSGLLIDQANKMEDQRKRNFWRKFWVAVSLILNLSILFFFKYFDFAVDNLNRVLGALNITLVQPEFDVILPVGISFYTFQALSYTMDVYRGDIYVERNVAKYALFVSFFPQLVAGPIERSKNLLTQIGQRHTFSFTRARDGLLLMLWGYFQKLVIADRVAILVNSVYGTWQHQTGVPLLVATLFFAIQIYCDFASYSNIAIGAAQVMGFKLMDNFDTPYFATSVAGFWRRWHISLTTWFRDYLYIPLGGNRCGKVRHYLNIMIVFLASGLWHGASWTFVLWGFFNGAFQVVGSLLKPVRDRLVRIFLIDRSSFSHKLLKAAVTFGLINFTWVFFRADSIYAAIEIFKRFKNYFYPWMLVDGSLFTLGLKEPEFYLTLICIGVLFVVSLLKYKGMHIRETLAKQGLWFRWLIYILAILAILNLGVYGPEFDASQFIYFQF